ncbi:MAG: cation:proton antiporter family protein [Patescibacteria group bacterium]
MFSELFLEIAAVMMTAGVFSLIAYALRQPLVIAYILTGIIVGPAALGFAQSADVFETLSRVGVAFLLFIVGLNLNWRNIKDVGFVALASGVAQMLITSAAGWGIGQLLGFSGWTSVFLGVSFAFSSTIIIVKMLTDKEDIERLYGRIAVGALIVQDLIAMVLLLFLSAYGAGGTVTDMVTGSFIKAIAAVAILWFLAKFAIPKLFAFAAKNQELLFLMAIAWCFAVAGGLQILGFGIEIGALMAGVALAGTGFQHEIEARVRVVRDFFLIIFFIVLGTHLNIDNISSLLLPGLAFASFVLIGNPIIMLVIMKLMGYHPRTGFLAGTTVAQISEFSFILIGGGIAAGLITADALPLATMVGLLTIAISSYLITYNERIFEFLAHRIPWLRGTTSENEGEGEHSAQIVLIGFDRMGQEIYPMMEDVASRFLIIDFNPSVVEDLKHRDIPVMYGDAGSEDVLKLARIHESKMVISTIPDMEVNADILDFVQARGSKTLVVVTVKNSDDAARCYALGAHFVIVPSILGGAHFAQLLKKTKLLKRGWHEMAKKYQTLDV